MRRGLALLLGTVCGCRQVLGFSDVTVDPDARAVDGPTADAQVDSAADAPPVVPVHVRNIQVVSAKVTGGPHANFPMLVSISDPLLRTVGTGGHVADPSGFDLRFTADVAGTMPLAHEVERYDGATGALVAWVKVPALTGTTELFLHYGDPTITTSQENRPAVWSENYVGVFHLTQLVDATGHAATTDAGSTAVAGQIAGARAFDGSTSSVTINSAASNSNVFNGGGTIEAWFFATSAGQANFGRIVDKAALSFNLGDGNSPGSLQLGRSFTQSPGNWRTPTGTVTLNTWTHAVVTYDDSALANTPTFYIGGIARNLVVVNAPAGAALSDMGAPLKIGDRSVTGGRAFQGNIDEARLSSVIRSAGWIATSFANQSDPASFITVGPE